MRVYNCLHTHIYIYIHMCIHMHRHMHTHTNTYMGHLCVLCMYSILMCICMLFRLHYLALKGARKKRKKRRRRERQETVGDAVSKSPDLCRLLSLLACNHMLLDSSRGHCSCSLASLAGQKAQKGALACCCNWSNLVSKQPLVCEFRVARFCHSEVWNWQIFALDYVHLFQAWPIACRRASAATSEWCTDFRDLPVQSRLFHVTGKVVQERFTPENVTICCDHYIKIHTRSGL